MITVDDRDNGSHHENPLEKLAFSDAKTILSVTEFVQDLFIPLSRSLDRDNGRPHLGQSQAYFANFTD